MNLTRTHRFALPFALVLLVLAALPALAGAQLQTIDFESGAPLGSPIDSVGEVSFSKADGFRPYRADVGARAHSGTTVGDLGHCLEESEEAGACEFFHALTKGRLARTADKVTLFAGMFSAANPPEVATLTAYRADGSVIAGSGPVAIDAGGFDQELTVTSAAGDIASFAVEASAAGGGPAGDLGIDDVKVSFADGAKPDFSLSTTGEVVALVQGQEKEVPLTIARLNGSNGPVAVSLSNLPAGVTATVAPNPVSNAETAATVTLKAAANAPDTKFIPTEAIVKADPAGDPDVGPAPRVTGLSVRVAANFGLAIGDDSDTSLPPGAAIPVEVPDCAPLDLPLRVNRDIANDQDVSLTIRAASPEAIQLPPHIQGQFLPEPVVHPGGALSAERTLRLSADDAALIPAEGVPLVVEGKIGSGPGASTHLLPLRLFRALPEATIATSTPGSRLAATPQLGKQGTRVRVHGSGFCPGATVTVGNYKAQAPTTLVDDHTIEFTVPRYGTSGPVTILRGAPLPAYTTTDTLIVDNFRNTDAFQFQNFSGGDLSLSELTEAFSNDIFIRVNPCWPWGDCAISTGILSPVAAVEWGVLDQISGAEGHCFGLALGSNDLRTGKVPFRRLISLPASGRFQVFDVPSRAHPSGAAGSFLDVEHVKQFSDEFLSAYLDRKTSLSDQLRVLEAEFAHNRTPIIGIKEEGESNGHVVVAYDMTQTAAGADISVWDSNRAYGSNEDSAGALHQITVDEGVIHIDKSRRTWSFTMAHGPFADLDIWKGRNDGTLWVQSQNTVPAHSSMPGLGTLASYIESVTFGSAGGSVRTSGGSKGAEYLPVADGRSRSAAPTNGTWISDDPRRPLSVHFVGTRDGAYSQSYSAPGFTAAALKVRTEKGVRDSVAGDGDSLTFSSGRERPLRLELARESGTGGEAATLSTTASAHGTDSAGFAAGDLTYAHEGAATTLRFSLTAIHRDGGPATFVSGPVRVRDGERLRAEPAGRGMARMRLTIRGPHGARRTLVLRNRGAAHRRLRLSGPKVAGRHLSLRFKAAGVRGRAIAGATLRLVRGGRVVARRALAIRARNGAGTIAWRLPRGLGRGRYRLVADVRALTVGGRGITAAANVSGRRTAIVRVGR